MIVVVDERQQLGTIVVVPTTHRAEVQSVQLAQTECPEQRKTLLAAVAQRKTLLAAVRQRTTQCTIVAVAQRTTVLVVPAGPINLLAAIDYPQLASALLRY